MPIKDWCEHGETSPCVFERTMESFMVLEIALRLKEEAGICLEERGEGAQKLLDRERCSNKGENREYRLSRRQKTVQSGCSN